MRRVEVWDKEKERIIVLLTNQLDFGATTIAAIYKDRWSIETFFKMIKYSVLWLWLDKPYEVKALVPGEEQLTLAFR